MNLFAEHGKQHFEVGNVRSVNQRVIMMTTEIVSQLLGADHESIGDLLRELQLELQRHELARSFDLLDRLWARLAVHIRAENLCLFPKLLDSPELFSERPGVPSFHQVAKTIEVLRADHNFFMDELSRVVNAMRGIAGDLQGTPEVANQLDAIRERIVGLALRLTSHNVLEEDKLYTWPALVLTASELERLVTEMDRQIHNMPPRFAVMT